MEQVSIRPLEKKDFGGYAGLRLMGLETDPTAFWASKEEVGPEFRQKFEGTVTHAFNFSMGAFEEGKLLGMMTFIRHPQQKISFKGDIVGVYLHPDARGKKIGDRLLAAIIERAFGMEGVTKLMLAVTANNPVAKGLYVKHGFKEYGIEKRGMRVGEVYYDQYFMELVK